MRTILKLLCAAVIMGAAVAPSFAMGWMNKMDKGHSMMIMSDGSMMGMDSMSATDSASMMKMMKPMSKCTVVMMGSDGKMYMMQASDKKCSAMGKM